MRGTVMLVALVSALSVAAPNMAAAQDGGFTVTSMDVGPVVGLGGISGASASFGGRFEKAFKELPNLANGILSIGVAVDAYHYSDSFSAAGFSYGYDYSFVPFAVTVNYHYPLENRKIDPFFGAGLGYLHSSASLTGTACNVAGCIVSGADSGVYPVGHVGIRYFVQPKLALYADAGAGYGALHVGVMFELGGR
jgi:hypothetical protein